MTATFFIRWLARLGHRKSIKHCESVRQVNDAVLQRARRAICQGDLELAFAFVQECGDAAEHDAPCLNVLGLIAEARNDWDEARRCWSRALRVDPSYVPAAANLRRWMELFYWGKSGMRVTYGDEPNSLLALRNRNLQ